MSDLFESLAFLYPEQRDSIRFHIAKGLAYRTRKNLILTCLLAGLLLQIVTVKVWTGFPFLIVAVLLGLVKGYDSRIRLKNFKNDQRWTEVSIDKLREMETMHRKSKAWDRDSLDVTNALGFAVFLLLIAFGALLCIVIGFFAGNSNVTLIMLVDFLVLVVPFYFTGVRRALKQGNLAVKVKLLLNLHKYFERNKIESETFVPMLLLACEKGDMRVPVDVKFQIRYKGLPPDRFYGIQSTVNINLVQGMSYIYFYCVLVAKRGFGLKKYQHDVKESKRVMCEFDAQADSDALVIRHPTTKASGYYTDENACMEILSSAMDAARVIEKEYRQE